MERQPKLIKFPVDLIQRIEAYQRENYISSFCGAVYELIRKGLEVSDNKKDDSIDNAELDLEKIKQLVKALEQKNQ